MKPSILILCMIFCHIIDDYYLQGILASMKQRSWWEKNAPKEIYRHDYIMALIMHSISWSFMIMLPILINFGFNPPNAFIILWAMNSVIHGVIDDLKANKLKINLIQDQSIHLLQIFFTAIIILYC